MAFVEVQAFHEPIDLFILHLQELQPSLFLEDELRLPLEAVLDGETVCLSFELIHISVHFCSLLYLLSEFFIDFSLLLSFLFKGQLFDFVEVLNVLR